MGARVREWSGHSGKWFLDNKMIVKMRTRRNVIKIILTRCKSSCKARKISGGGENTPTGGRAYSLEKRD